MLQALRADRAANRAPLWVFADVLLALGFGALTVAQVRRPDTIERLGAVEGVEWLLLLAPTALIVLRRFAPATAMGAAVACYLVAGLWLGEGNAVLAIAPLAYTVALTRPPKVSAALCAVGAVLVSCTSLYGPGDIDEIDGGAPFVVFAFFAIGWAIGSQVRRSQLRQSALAQRAEATQEEIDAVARQAVTDERSRIARELHDAVGHSVNVMVMHAGAARLATSDERSGATLREIEQIGRAALGDLDRMLGLLDGEDGSSAPTEPTHGLGDIARLVEGVRAAGGNVHLDDRCGGNLDASFERPIGVAAYRIVQEALTNALKHAGPARVDVTVTCDDEELVVQVVDDGRGSAALGTEGGGRGIPGMRERATVHHGTLTAGPRVGGGFRVEAHLPREGASR